MYKKEFDVYKSYCVQVFYDALKIKSFLWFWLSQKYNSAISTSKKKSPDGKCLLNLLLAQDSVGGDSVVVAAAAVFYKFM